MTIIRKESSLVRKQSTIFTCVFHSTSRTAGKRYFSQIPPSLNYKKVTPSLCKVKFVSKPLKHPETPKTRDPEGLEKLYNAWISSLRKKLGLATPLTSKPTQPLSILDLKSMLSQIINDQKCSPPQSLLNKKLYSLFGTLQHSYIQNHPEGVACILEWLSSSRLILDTDTTRAFFLWILKTNQKERTLKALFIHRSVLAAHCQINSVASLIEEILEKEQGDRDAGWLLYSVLKTCLEGWSPEKTLMHSLLKHSLRIGLWNRAEQLLEDMVTFKLPLTKYTFAILIRPFAEKGYVQHAEQVYNEGMKEISGPDSIVLCTELIKAHLKAGEVSKPIQLIQHFLAKHGTADKHLFTVLFQGLLYQRNLLGVSEAISLMIRANVIPDAMIWSCLLRYCIFLQNEDKVKQLIRFLMRNRIHFSLNDINCILSGGISAYIQCRQLHSVRKLLLLSQFWGISFTNHTRQQLLRYYVYSEKWLSALSLLREFEREKEGNKAIEKLLLSTFCSYYPERVPFIWDYYSQFWKVQSRPPDLVCCTILLKALKGRSDQRLVQTLWSQIVSFHYPMDESFLTSFMNLLRSQGRWELAIQLWEHHFLKPPNRTTIQSMSHSLFSSPRSLLYPLYHPYPSNSNLNILFDCLGQLKNRQKLFYIWKQLRLLRSSSNMVPRQDWDDALISSMARCFLRCGEKNFAIHFAKQYSEYVGYDVIAIHHRKPSEA